MNYHLLITIVLASFVLTSKAVNSYFHTSVPFQNSVVVPGQDEVTVNQNRNLPSLVAVRCKKRHTAQRVIKAAKTACDKLKKLDPWVIGPVGWFRTYPVVYPIRRSDDGFDIVGKPYYIYPMFKPLLAPPGSHTDYVMINEHCQLVGAVMWGKLQKSGGKKSTFLYLFRKSPKGFKKCVSDRTRPKMK